MQLSSKHSPRKTSLFKLMFMLMKLELNSVDEWYWTDDEQYMYQPFLKRMDKDGLASSP